MAVVARSKQQDNKNDEHVALIHKNDQGAIIKHRQHAVGAPQQHGGGNSDKDHGLPAATATSVLASAAVKQRSLSSCSIQQYNNSTPFHKRIFWILALICTLTGAKWLIAATHDFKTFNSIDDYANGVWKWFEDRDIIQKWPGFVLDYQNLYPELQLLTDNWQVLRDEAVSLMTQKSTIPRMYDLVDPDRAKSSVYTADWKVMWLKMGFDIPPNQALAPKTTALIKQLPVVRNAFFSMMEPHIYIEPHWGHWRGFLRFHLGLVVPHNNTDQTIFLRSRPDLVVKDWSVKKEEKKKMLESGEIYYWKEGQGVMFDDVPLHDATNGSDGMRIVFFVDVERRNIPWYLHLYNKLILAFTVRFDPVASMRKNAAVDPNRELSKPPPRPGRRLSQERTIQQGHDLSIEIGE